MRKAILSVLVFLVSKSENKIQFSVLTELISIQVFISSKCMKMAFHHSSGNLLLGNPLTEGNKTQSIIKYGN